MEITNRSQSYTGLYSGAARWGGGPSALVESSRSARTGRSAATLCGPRWLGWGLGKGMGSAGASRRVQLELAGSEAGPERSSESVRLTSCPRCHHSAFAAPFHPAGYRFRRGRLGWLVCSWWRSVRPPRVRYAFNPSIPCATSVSRPSGSAIHPVHVRVDVPFEQLGDGPCPLAQWIPTHTAGLPRFRGSLAGSRPCRPVTVGPLRPSASPGG